MLLTDVTFGTIPMGGKVTPDTRTRSVMPSLLVRCGGVQGYALARQIGLKIRKPKGRNTYISPVLPTRQRFANLGTTSVQLKRRKNGFPNHKRHHTNHLSSWFVEFGTRGSEVQIPSSPYSRSNIGGRLTQTIVPTELFRSLKCPNSICTGSHPARTRGAGEDFSGSSSKVLPWNYYYKNQVFRTSAFSHREQNAVFPASSWQESGRGRTVQVLLFRPDMAARIPSEDILCF